MTDRILWWLMTSLVISLAVSSLIWIVYAPFILVRKQWRQYSVGFKAKVVLLIVVGVVLVITLWVTPRYLIHPSLTALVAVELIALSVILTLAIWAWAKRTVWKLEILILNKRESICDRQIRSNEKEVSQLEAQNNAIIQGKKKLQAQKDELMSISEELCREDPQVLTLGKRKWEDEYAAMSDEQLRLKRKRLEDDLLKADSVSARKQLDMELQAHLLRIEELKRAIENPDVRMVRNKEAIKKRDLSNRGIRRRMSELIQKREELEMLLAGKLELG